MYIFSIDALREFETKETLFAQLIIAVGRGYSITCDPVFSYVRVSLFLSSFCFLPYFSRTYDARADRSTHLEDTRIRAAIGHPQKLLEAGDSVY